MTESKLNALSEMVINSCVKRSVFIRVHLRLNFLLRFAYFDSISPIHLA